MSTSPIVIVVGVAAYFGLTSLVVFVDRRRDPRNGGREAEQNFVAQNQLAFSALSLFCGAPTLVVHFGVTRRWPDGWILGIAWAIAIAVVTFLAIWLAIVATGGAT